MADPMKLPRINAIDILKNDKLTHMERALFVVNADLLPKGILTIYQQKMKHRIQLQNNSWEFKWRVKHLLELLEAENE